MAIISHSDLSSLRKRHPGKKIVFCSGTFDMVHPGHVRFLEGCKKLGDILVVAVGTDAEIRRDKGKNRPIWNEQGRLEVIGALVHYSFLNPPATSTESFAPMREMLLAIKPDIWAVNYDASRMPFWKVLAKELDVDLKILELNRDDPAWKEYSTSRIIEKIQNLRK